jgi:hypothetical protein
MPPQNTAYIRTEAGKIYLIIVKDKVIADRIELRPANALSLVMEGAKVLWSDFDLVERGKE